MIRFLPALILLFCLQAPSELFSQTDWSEGWLDGYELPKDELPSFQEQVPKDKYCEGRLLLKSAIHGEAYEFKFRDKQGRYDQKVLQALYWFLRCRDGSWTQMDIRAIETLNYLSKLLGDPVIQINSGYRSPAYNKLLAMKSENVARNSLHQYGQAIDFSIPGIPIRTVCSYALYARNTMGYGGVGYYPNMGFVHLDSGNTRNWVR